jgi:hypothetical protein
MKAAGQDRDPETGLLSNAGLERALDAELSRAARHELPLSLVLLEITARSGQDLGEARTREIARAAAAALAGGDVSFPSPSRSSSPSVAAANGST